MEPVEAGLSMGIVSGVVGWFLDPGHWSGSNGVPARLGEHVVFSVVAIGLAIAIALPVGVAIGHTRRFEAVVSAAAGLGRAVPSYALLLLFIPFLGLGFASALPALVLLGIPPILVNAAAGIREVDGDAVEAGRGVGMTEREVLRDVELPAALPAIVAGLRTAAVQIVATATLAALVAGGGLGRYIVDGFGLRDNDRIVAGALLVAILALATERLLTLAERRAARHGGGPTVDAYGPGRPGLGTS